MTKTVLVYGTGISGCGAADALAKQGCRVLLYSDKETKIDNALLELLKKQGGGLPKEEGDLLRQILSGKKPAGVEGEALSLQVERNRALLERTLQADKALSRRLAGRESFYQS